MRVDTKLGRGHGLGHWLWIWGPAILAALIIFLESTDTFSANHTSNFLRPLIEKLFGTMRDPVWGAVHHDIRKTGHFTGYGLVSLAFLRGWLHTPERPDGVTRMRWWVRAAGLGVLSAAVIATLDEWHQSYIPSRTGVPDDVLLDTCGAVVACIIVLLVRRIRRGRSEMAEVVPEG